MKYLFILGAIILNFSIAQAQYVPPVRGLEDMAVYCHYSYLAKADSKYYTIAPGETKELLFDLRNLCSSIYQGNDISIQTTVVFRDDPRWQKNKDQIAVQGLRFEVIDAETGANLVELAKSLGLPACNWGAGFVFSDLRALPASLRPMKLRLTNVGRSSVDAAMLVQYTNASPPSACGDYPRSR